MLGHLQHPELVLRGGPEAQHCEHDDSPAHRLRMLSFRAVRRRDPITILQPWEPIRFPDPREAPADAPLAIGGDLRPERLLLAYDQGIFPWYEAGIPPLWWSPDPRTVLNLDTLHVARSMQRVLRRGGFQLSWNRAFARVMQECGKERADGTWILPEMLEAYQRLHALGHAHSLEVWSRGGELIGGLYGVQRGGLFAAESMFHRVRDMSKVALICAVRALFAAGIEVFDVQLMTPHLQSLGAVSWPRARYLDRLAEVRGKQVALRQLQLRN